MATRDVPTLDRATSRARAKPRLSERTRNSAAADHDAPESPWRRVHELEVHQFELELMIEELKAAQTELEVRLERYSDLYDFAPVGYVTLDTVGAIQKVNFAGARLLGQERSRLVGANFDFFVAPESRPAFAAFVRRVFASKSKEVLDVELCPVERVPSWVHIEAMASGNGDIECRAVLVDVTRRRQLEDSLRLRVALLDYAVGHSPEELLQKTLDMVQELTDSPIGFYHLIDPDETMLSLEAWSTRTMKEFRAAQEPSSHYPTDRVDVCAECIHQRKPVIHNDEPWNAHRWLREGSSAVTSELAVPVFRSNMIVAVVGVGKKPSEYTDEDVQIVSHLADVAWTVIERERGEQALMRSEQRFRSLFESMDEGFALCEMLDDPAGQPVDFRYLEVNSAFARQTGLDLERVIGRTASEVIPGIEKLWIEAYSRVTRTGLSERIDSRMESLGKHFEVRAWRADLNRFAVTFSDVTALRQSEESRRISQRMESIGRLAGGIAHDFNNMLTVIINYTALALNALDEPASLQDNLTEILTAGNRAAALTKQLLAFSRGQVLRPKVLDLNRIVSGIEDMLRKLLGEDVSLAVVLAMGLGKVMADPGQIEQVLMNLAVNARDAMPDGGKLTIETANFDCNEACAHQHPEIPCGPHVRLSVTDTGCGMDDHTQARIFEPFFTTKEVGKGTGLGLATVYGIVKQSGGAIQVRSEPGKGSTFTVVLPRELAESETVARASTLTTRAVDAETVLVVEDEATLRILFERVLIEAGYTVLSAANGREALRICEQHKGSVQLLLTDVVMPEMNGKDLADQLVRKSPHLRVLFMSGYTNEALGHRGILAPGTHFIAKPFNPAQLTLVMRKVLDGEMPTDLACDEPNSSRVGNESS